MKDRMNVPEEYEPVLPGKVQAYIAKKKAAAAIGEQIIWYQCLDSTDHWAQGGHKLVEEGMLQTAAVLKDPSNEGAIMVTFADSRLFTIQDGTMLPANSVTVSSGQ